MDKMSSLRCPFDGSLLSRRQFTEISSDAKVAGHTRAARRLRSTSVNTKPRFDRLMASYRTLPLFLSRLFLLWPAMRVRHRICMVTVVLIAVASSSSRHHVQRIRCSARGVSTFSTVVCWNIVRHCGPSLLEVHRTRSIPMARLA
jgi:hypothetical protein